MTEFQHYEAQSLFFCYNVGDDESVGQMQRIKL